MSTRTVRSLMPVLVVLGTLAAIPARGGFVRCGLADDGMPDTPLSSPVTFAQFCGSSFSSAPLQQLSPLGAIDTSMITGVEFTFTISSVSPGFFNADATVHFNGGPMGSVALSNVLSGGCGFGSPLSTPQISGPGKYDTLECSVSQTADTAFLTQLQTGTLYVALSGANGADHAEYTDASVTFFTSASVPEPSTVTSVMTGIAILAALRRGVVRR